jgi:hypothetical protein
MNAPIKEGLLKDVTSLEKFMRDAGFQQIPDAMRSYLAKAEAEAASKIAAVAQAEYGIAITGCPVDGCDGLYQQTGELHEGVPHYINGTMHLYYHRYTKQWFISNAFTPDKAAGLATIAVTGVALPMGQHSWKCFTRKKWRVKIVTTAVPMEPEPEPEPELELLSSVGLGKDKMWSEMTEDERQAVVELGWSQVSWDNDGANATLFCC